MLPEEPGHFSQVLMMLASPDAQDADPMGMGVDVITGEGMEAPPPGMGMPMDPGMGMDPSMMGMDPSMGMGSPAFDPANKEALESLIRDYLFEAGRKRLEASLAYQQNVAAQNGLR